MGEHELEQMVVTINADMAGYKQALHEAVAETSHAAHAIEEHGNRFERLGHKAEGLAHSVVSGLEALGVEHFLHEALGEWQEAESGLLKLTATLEANGREVEKTREDYEDFASSMQELTVYSDDAVLAMLRSAETFGLTGNAAKSAAQNAIALAAVTGGNASGMIRFTAALERGDTATAMRMARMIPQLRGIKDQAQFAAKAGKLLEAGWATTRAEANSSAGSLKQLKNAYGDLLEDLGRVVADGIKPFVGYVREGVALLKALSPETKQMAVYILAVGAALLMIGPLLTALGIAFGPVISLVGMLAPLAGVLFNPWVLGIAAVIGLIVLVMSYFVDLKGIAGEALGWIARQWESLVEYFKPAFEGIKSALAAGDLELAFKVAVLQLKLVWTEFNVWFVEYWNATKDVFVDGFHDATVDVGDYWLDLLTYMRSNWKLLFDGLMEGWAQLMSLVGKDSAAEAIRRLAKAPIAEFQQRIAGTKQLLKEEERLRKQAAQDARAQDLANAREEAENAKKALAEAVDDAWQEAFWADFWKEADKKSTPHIKLDPKDKPEIDAKIVPKFDAAEFRSAEAFARVREFQENLRLQMETNPEGKGKKEPDANTPILEDIRDELKDQDTVGVAKLG